MMSQSVKVYRSFLKSGKIKINGFKHAAVPIIAATIFLPNTRIVLKNVPRISDTIILSKILQQLGASATLHDNELHINTANLTKHIVPMELSEKIHGALYLLPTLLSRCGKIVLGRCGGCQIGNHNSFGSNRPISHMVSILVKFGCEFHEEAGFLFGKTSGLHANTIDIMEYSDSRESLQGPLVSGATKTAILSAMAVKDGVTKILNPYFKPDVTELLEFLKLAGYHIEANAHEINISSSNQTKQELVFTLMPDICEIMTYLTCAAYHDIPELTLENLSLDKVKQGLKSEFEHLDKMNIRPVWGENSLTLKSGENITINSTNLIVTGQSIYSDHHPMFSLLLSKAQNLSTITDHVWQNRFGYAEQLKKFGLKFTIDKNVITIYPSNSSIGKQILMAPDLRAAAILLIAAFKAPYYTIIHQIDHLTRGYENLLEGLVGLGGQIEVFESETLQRIEIL